MATATSLSSPGIGSGLDVNAIITGLLAVEQRPVQVLQRAEARLQAKLSGFGQIQSLTSTLNDALATLSKPETFKQTIASSSDASSVFVSSSTTATAASYSVSVSKLAAAQTLVSPTGQFSVATDVVGTGTITIRLGDWNNVTPPTQPNAFTPKAGSSDVVIPIDTADQSLQGVRDKINAANAGVTASIVTDASGARLSIRSNSTGETNGFRINVAESGAAGLARLQYDPQTIITPGAPTLTYAQAASNTEGTINGIAVSSTSDSLADAIQGVSFRFNKITTSPVTVSVNTNVDAIRSAVNKLVSAYNDFSSVMGQQTSYDAGTKKAGLFQGDATAVGLLSQVRSYISQSTTASSAFSSLSSMGVELQKDGSLKVNSTKLDAALTNLPELSKAFSNVGTGGNSVGLAKRFGAYTEGLLAATGTFQSQSKSIRDSITANTKDQQRVNDRLALTEQRLRAQYSALDVTMSRNNALNNYVTQQFSNNNNNNR
ncbi:MAG: flagellar filament capping protein FliD [Rhizobacter sp.]